MITYSPAGDVGLRCVAPTTCPNPPCGSCPPESNFCVSAVDLGGISGDTGAQTLTRTGVGSQWFHVRIREDDSQFSPVALSARLTLSSAPGTDYDLYVYVSSCAGESHSSTSRNSGEVLDFVRTDTMGADDSFDLWIEVRRYSGDCGAGQQWQLQVSGNVSSPASAVRLR